MSIGEFRACITLINQLLKAGETIHLTCITPVARRAIRDTYEEALASGQLTFSWAPLDTVSSVVRAIHRIRPKAILISEIEIWPEQIFQARAHQIPLILVNAQYLERSYTRDIRASSWRFRAISQVRCACVKSETHAARFQAAGVPEIVVTGELRFDQPRPTTLIETGLTNRAFLASIRPTIGFVSIIDGEDSLCLEAMAQLKQRALESGQPSPLFIYVPRAPERFDDVYRMLISRDFVVARRSVIFDATFHAQGNSTALSSTTSAIDVVLGDSMGEMYGYLAMTDRVVVGGSFAPKGAHNISEAIALGKPVYTGPFLHTIEFPAVEAEAAGVLTVVSQSSDALVHALSQPAPDLEAITAFFHAQTGATERTVAAITRILEADACQTKSAHDNC